MESCTYSRLFALLYLLYKKDQVTINQLLITSYQRDYII